MFSTQVAVLLMAFASVTLAGVPLLAEKGYYAYPKYSYAYGVDDAVTGDHKTASETRDGGVVKGSYSLVQPDGVLRTVEYIADPIHGFQAKVINSAPAVHAVKKVAPVAPVAAYAAQPFIGGHGGYHGGYGNAIVKPAAVAYTQALGPSVFGGGHYGGGHYGGGHYGGGHHGGGHFGAGYAGAGFHGGY